VEYTVVVRLRVSVTLRYCIKMAKSWITQIMLHDNGPIIIIIIIIITQFLTRHMSVKV